jgi:hypothetical protein
MRMRVLCSSESVKTDINMRRPRYEFHHREHTLVMSMFTNILYNEECCLQQIYLIQ